MNIARGARPWKWRPSPTVVEFTRAPTVNTWCLEVIVASQADDGGLRINRQGGLVHRSGTNGAWVPDTSAAPAIRLLGGLLGNVFFSRAGADESACRSIEDVVQRGRSGHDDPLWQFVQYMLCGGLRIVNPGDVRLTHQTHVKMLRARMARACLLKARHPSFDTELESLMWAPPEAPVVTYSAGGLRTEASRYMSHPYVRAATVDDAEVARAQVHIVGASPTSI